MKTKQTKAQKIALLERKLMEAESQLVHLYHFASIDLQKVSIDKLMGSGVIITLTTLGGTQVVPPTMIRNGLSKETLEALNADFVRSYEYAMEFKPKGCYIPPPSNQTNPK